MNLYKNNYTIEIYILNDEFFICLNRKGSETGIN